LSLVTSRGDYFPNRVPQIELENQMAERNENILKFEKGTTNSRIPPPPPEDDDLDPDDGTPRWSNYIKMKTII